LKSAWQVTPEKLRGAFYSPPALARLCLDRVAALLPGAESLRLLEPSAGTGAFLRALADHELGSRVREAVAVDIDPGAENHHLVRRGSFLDDDLVAVRAEFDVAVGNPPFVRFQFVDRADRSRAERLAESLQVNLRGVANLWIPILLKALACVRDGGAFAFVVPAECLTGVSARTVRVWLLENTTRLHIDVFKPGSFPDVVQEVIVLSGQRRDRSQPIDPVVAVACGSTWEHRLRGSEPTWTRLLLPPVQLDALESATDLPAAVRLRTLARFGVATVTGANDFFTVDEATISGYDLGPWTRPLVARLRDAPGLAFTEADHRAAARAGSRVALVDLDEEPDPGTPPAAYLAKGVAAGLPERYKCRIRSPWYRLPVVPPGNLLLSKRSHRFPRVVRNDVGACTTDTIYQARLLGPVDATTLATSFHNSLTLLCAELDGRSFGGGVLELVPSEVAGLWIVPEPSMADEFGALDGLARSAEPEALVAETDRLLAKRVPGLDAQLLETLAGARISLQHRRFARNRGGGPVA
jgi:hypothetical protein